MAQTPKKKPTEDDWVDVPASKTDDDWKDVEPTKSADQLINEAKDSLKAAGKFNNPESIPTASEPSSFRIPVPGILKEGWDAVNRPLTELLPDYLNPAKLARRASEYITTPELDDSPLTSKLKGFAGGATEGLGDLTAALSSPLNLGMTLATGGSSLAARQGLKTATGGLGLAGRILSVPFAVHGGAEVIRPDATLGERGMGLAEMAGGIAGMAHTPTPVRKPRIETIADNMGEPPPPPPLSANPNFAEQVLDTSGRPLANAAENAPINIRPEGPWGENGAVIPDRRMQYDPYTSVLEKQGRGELRRRAGDVAPQKSNINVDRTTGEIIENPPTATFAMHQPDFENPGQSIPLYHADVPEGHPLHRSTVTAETLAEHGIEVPDTPVFDPNVKPQKPLTLEERQSQTLPNAPEFGEQIPRMPTPDSLNPEFDARRQAMIDDTARMQYERENAPRNMEREAANEEWNRRQRNTNRYEGTNSNDAITPLTPKQQIINDSYKKIRDFKDEHSAWFSEQEEKLPEGEFFVEPPESKAKYQAKLDAMEDAHQELVDKLDPLEKPSLPDIEIPAAPRGFSESVSPPVDSPPPMFNRRGMTGETRGMVGGEMPSQLPTEGIANDMSTKPPTSDTGIPKSESVSSPKLPADLRGAKPRFNMGGESYTPNFESDLDKALYIIAQKTPSKRNADYLKFAMEHTGLDEKGVMEAAIEVRKKIKGILSGQEAGEVNIPSIHEPNPQPKLSSDKPVTVNSLKEPTPELVAQAQAKGPDTINIKNPTPETVKRAGAYGYKFEGVNEDGTFRFKKGPVEEQPILESEVGTTRPKVGSVADAKKSSMVAEVLNFPRAIMASMDFSAPLRQGIGLIHKKAFRTAFLDMFKSGWSEEMFNASQKAISEKPLFKTRTVIDKVTGKPKEIPSFAKEAGLKLTDLNDLSNREEAIMSTLVEKIPGIGRAVRGSNRAYTTFLNKLRADTFEELMQSSKVLGADGKANLPLARGLADFVNTATGRGSLGPLERSATALNTGLFAPRLIASRIKMLNPHYYITANPIVRKEALKSLLAITAVGNTVGQLSKMIPGAKVETDPGSADYGKVRIGNIHIDPWAGFQQYVIAAQKVLRPQNIPFTDTPMTVGKPTRTGIVPLDLATGLMAGQGGRVKSTTTGNSYQLGEKFGRPTRLDVAGRFLESKSNPLLSFATAFLRGKDYNGQPFNVPEEVASRFVPIFIQDLKQLATENPNLLPNLSGKGKGSYDELHPENLPAAIPAMFGMGVQQYKGKQ